MEVINKLEYLIGTKVNEQIPVSQELHSNINPRATIYGFIPINIDSNEDIYFKTYKEYALFKQTHYFTDRYYYKIDYYGNLFGCCDVMKITTGFFEKNSQIYTPNLEHFGFYDISEDELGKLISCHNSPDIDIHINKIYDALHEIGVRKETSSKKAHSFVKKVD